MVSPYVFRVQEMQVIQKKDEVLLLYMQDHQIRHVRLNGTHPAKITPSWYGDSIGHYEGETLVVDTIGYKLGPAPVLDMFGSPFSEGLQCFGIASSYGNMSSRRATLLSRKV